VESGVLPTVIVAAPYYLASIGIEYDGIGRGLSVTQHA
jgi:hypothetical protein